jgi:hypothetical protein
MLHVTFFTPANFLYFQIFALFNPGNKRVITPMPRFFEMKSRKIVTRCGGKVVVKPVTVNRRLTTRFTSF